MSRFVTLFLAVLCVLALPATLPAEDYAVDAGHSSVVFKIQHLGASDFFGRFNNVSGELSFDPKKLEESRVKVSVKASSVDTNSKDRDTHVNSEEFLHSEKHPDIVFEGKGFKKKGDDTYEVEGTLTFRGVEKEMKVIAKLVGQGDHPRFGKRIGFTCTFQILRSDFGIQFPTSMLSDEVEITVGLECMIPPKKE